LVNQVKKWKKWPPLSGKGLHSNELQKKKKLASPDNEPGLQATVDAQAQSEWRLNMLIGKREFFSAISRLNQTLSSSGD
jgi:hypothetical protein